MRNRRWKHSFFLPKEEGLMETLESKSPTQFPQVLAQTQ